jgi:NADP-dependent 3-hydroxy acid dehydrogenase YdfG
MTTALQDTAALVTGASSGIGEATARALADQGARVAVAARRKDRLDALAAEIGGLPIEADVTDREHAVAAVERAAPEFGRLDIVINNAGVMLLGPIRRRPGRGSGIAWSRSTSRASCTSRTPRCHTC